MRRAAAFIFFPLLFSFVLHAQPNNTNSQLALKYLKNKEYEKAATLYLELYEATRSKTYFSYYIQCLVEMEEYREAEKFVKSTYRDSRNDLSLLVELGYVYKRSKDKEKATEQYEKAIKKVPADRFHIINLANTFITKREYEYAEQVYKKGKNELKGLYTFSFELANIYFYQRKYGEMINEYLDILEINDMYLQNVQNRLQSAIQNDIDNSVTELLKKNLIKRIQKSGSNIIFNEMLIWLFIQERDFKNALIQVKALDSRNKENGERLMALGDLAASNRNYDVSIKAYNYVIEKGKNQPYYIAAKNKYLQTLYEKIITNSAYTLDDIKNLETRYLTTVNELGEGAHTFSLIQSLSHIQAFYLDKKQEAIDRLENLLENHRLSKTQTALCKTELGDVLLANDDPWSATLYYAQAEKLLPDHPIGHEAKYKKAKLAYYTGDFLWAQAQLDILKASTSKLIANDALELSLLISDNTMQDTAGNALKKFARADLYIFQNKDSVALLVLDSLYDSQQAFNLADEIIFKKARIARKNRNLELAAKYYTDLIEQYSYDILADDALFNLAEIYESQPEKKEKAKELYKQLLLEFPGSIYTIKARKRFRILRGDNIEPEEPKHDLFQGIY